MVAMLLTKLMVKALSKKYNNFMQRVKRGKRLALFFSRYDICLLKINTICAIIYARRNKGF